MNIDGVYIVYERHSSTKILILFTLKISNTIILCIINAAIILLSDFRK